MKTYKIEIKLTEKQKQIYKLNISAGRFVYNLFIQKNNELYKNNEKYMNNYDFSKWFNNEYIKENEDKNWLKQASSKHIRKTMMNCDESYKRFFKHIGGKPKFKKSSTDKTGYYFVRSRKDIVIKHTRNKINIPCIGWVTLKEINYLPVSSIITSGIITKRADRYFISLLTEDILTQDFKNNNDGIGIDLGIKEFITCSNGLVFKNINKTKQIKKLEKRNSRLQRSLSRKLEVRKKDKTITTYKNIDKNKLQLQRVNYRIECIRNAYINKCIDLIIQQNPNFITIEDLNIKGMLKNKYLSKHIKDNKFYYFVQTLIQKCAKHNIEVRQVNRFYPSSKTCCICGNINKDLKLSDRQYVCKCGNNINRDFNASINLKKAIEYKVLNKTTGGLPESNAYGQYKNLLVVNNNFVYEGILEEIRKSQFVDKFFDLVYIINKNLNTN